MNAFHFCTESKVSKTVWISETDALQEETTFHHPPEAKIRS